MKAIEVEGTVDEEGQLHLDEPLTTLGPGRVRVILLSPDEDDLQEREWPLTTLGPGRVRVILLSPDEDDLQEREWFRAASRNAAFDFLKDAEEDIYTPTDGKPFRDEG